MALHTHSIKVSTVAPRPESSKRASDSGELIARALAANLNGILEMTRAKSVDTLEPIGEVDWVITRIRRDPPPDGILAKLGEKILGPSIDEFVTYSQSYVAILEYPDQPQERTV